MIAVVDLGIGNFANVARSVNGLVTDDPYTISRADKLILPGVGSAYAVSDRLKALSPVILEKVSDGIPLLGICLGMQLLTSESLEGNVKGLGIIKGQARKMVSRNLPHIGWNTIDVKRNNYLLKNIPEHSYFYFVHSYRVSVNEESVIALTEYGGEVFPSVIAKDNVIGVQFHPEKSSRTGRVVIENFIRGRA